MTHSISVSALVSSPNWAEYLNKESFPDSLPLVNSPSLVAFKGNQTVQLGILRDADAANLDMLFSVHKVQGASWPKIETATLV